MSTLRQVPMHPSGRPATKEEQFINEKLFGECNHRDWTGFTHKNGRHILLCNECKCEFDYGDDYEPPKLKPSEFLLTTIRKYSAEPVLSNLILRRIETSGWRPVINESDGLYSCVLECGGLKFQSEKRSSREQAICEAAARLAASGKFSTKSDD